MPVWKIQGLTAVWFFDGMPGAHREALFKTLSNLDPQSQQMGQLPQPNSGQIWSLAAQDSDLSFNLQVQTGRIDFALSGIAKTADDIPLLDVAKTIDRMTRSVSAAAPAMQNTTRMALIGEFNRPVDNMASANRELSRVLGIDTISDDATDFIFQINRRKEFSGTGDLWMNRVMNWSVATIQTFKFNGPMPSSMMMPVMGGLAAGTQIHESYAAFLKADLNTHSPHPRKFTTEEQIDISRQLCSEMNRLAQQNSPRGLA